MGPTPCGCPQVHDRASPTYAYTRYIKTCFCSVSGHTDMQVQWTYARNVRGWRKLPIFGPITLIVDRFAGDFRTFLGHFWAYFRPRCGRPHGLWPPPPSAFVLIWLTSPLPPTRIPLWAAPKFTHCKWVDTVDSQTGLGEYTKCYTQQYCHDDHNIVITQIKNKYSKYPTAHTPTKYNSFCTPTWSCRSEPYWLQWAILHFAPIPSQLSGDPSNPCSTLKISACILTEVVGVKKRTTLNQRW